MTSDLQFYRARDLPRMFSSPAVDVANRRKCRRLRRLMRVHRRLDDLRNRGKTEPPLEKLCNGDFIRRIQDDGQALLGFESAIREAKAGKRLGVGGLKFESA